LYVRISSGSAWYFGEAVWIYILLHEQRVVEVYLVVH
jgi:hypothetical protein